MSNPLQPSETMRAIQLEQVITRLEWQRDTLLNALKRLQGECFCGVGIGDPNYGGTHTDACIRAREAIATIEQAREPAVSLEDALIGGALLSVSQPDPQLLREFTEARDRLVKLINMR